MRVTHEFLGFHDDGAKQDPIMLKGQEAIDRSAATVLEANVAASLSKNGLSRLAAISPHLVKFNGLCKAARPAVLHPAILGVLPTSTLATGASTGGVKPGSRFEPGLFAAPAEAAGASSSVD